MPGIDRRGATTSSGSGTDLTPYIGQGVLAGINPSGSLAIPTLFDPASTSWDDQGWWTIEWQPANDQWNLIAGSKDIRLDPDSAWVQLIATPQSAYIAAAQYNGNGEAALTASPTQTGVRVQASSGQTSSAIVARTNAGTAIIDVTGDSKIGFFGAAPVTQRTGVAVSTAGIHAALVSLGLITA